MKLLKEFWYGNIEPTEYDSDASNSDQRLEVLWCNFELPGLFGGLHEKDRCD